MVGYTRQSTADIINGSEVTAPPLTAEFNQIAAAFHATSGHSHDGSTGGGPKVNLATSLSGVLPVVHGGTGGKHNLEATTTPQATDDIGLGYAVGSLWENTTTSRIYFCVGNTNNAAVWREVVQVTSGTGIIPSATNTIDVGSTAVRFKDAWLSGDVTAAGDISVGGELVVTGTTGLQGMTATSGGFTTVSATGGFTGPLEGAVTGNITAATGNSSFTNLTVNGTIDVTNTVIKNVANPVLGTDAATKAYVDTEVSALIAAAPDALNTLNEIAAALGDDASFSTTVTNSIATKLPKAGGTMSGAIAMGGHSVSGLPTPLTGTDAATKGYIDATFGSTSSAANSATAAAASATSAATSETNAAASETASASSQTSATASQSSATTSETNAASSATASAVSATASAASSVVAGTSETNAATSAVTATTSATNAAASETAAGTSATNASASEAAVASNATAAASSATAAGTSETNAAASAVTAASNATGTLLKSNNLSDLASATTARTNLGLSTVAASGSYTDLSNQPAPFDPATLATVATSGSFNDLTNQPAPFDPSTLGTAAQTDTTAYATAAQGVTANAALPKAGGTMTGNLTLSGSGPLVKLNDTTAGADDFYVHANSNTFYVLADRDDAGGHEAPHPLTLSTLTNKGHLFGSEIINASGGTLTGNLNASTTLYARDIRAYGGAQFVINAGESHTVATGQTAEFVYINAESGLQVNSSPNNWSSGWAGRHTTTICDSSGNSSFPGNVTADSVVVTGTVDGRDVATDGTKLDGIESGATADQSAAQILTAIKTVDGAGSGLNADLLDGISSANYLRSNVSDTFTGTLTVAGSIVASGDITASSDIRLKNNIEVIDDAVTKVQALRGVTFDMNGKRSTGVIAQELEAVLPEAVLDNEDGMKSVAYGNVVGLLIEAIKELTERVNSTACTCSNLKETTCACGENPTCACET